MNRPSNPAPGRQGAVLVTGGAIRMGATLARRLAEDGWAVAIHCRRSQEAALALCRELQAAGHHATVCTLDFDSREALMPQALDRWLEEIDQALGLPLLGMVHNASRFEFDDPLQATLQGLDQHLLPNLAAPVLLTQALHRRLSATGHQGFAIALLDQKLENPNPDFFSYTLSKAALAEAVRLMARAYAPVMRVMAISPGISLPSADQTVEEFREAHTATPLGRSSEPSDIAEAVCFMARARAITGVNLLVDGGQHLLPTARDILFIQRQQSGHTA